MRVLTCMGDPHSLLTWSGTPWFFLQAGRRAGFLDDGWRVRPEALRAHRLIWNVARLLRLGERGGYQYSKACISRLLGQINDPDEPTELVSHFPLFPPAGRVRGRLSFYLDATLAQVFEDYGLAQMVGPRMVREALAREAEQYAAADRIVCMASWTARSVVERYGVRPAKVHVVPGGANLIEDGLPAAKPGGPPDLRPLRLGFIGKDWQRKGLPFLLDVAEVIRRRGHPVEVIAAGFAPHQGPRHPLLRAVGFVDKYRDMVAFVALIRTFHFGCLFSRAEASPRSNIECLRLGVPVLALRVGGIPDTVPAGLGHLFAPDAPPEAVAEVILPYLREPDRYQILQERISRRAKEFTWDHQVQRLIAIWNGSDEHSYAKPPGR